MMPLARFKLRRERPWTESPYDLLHKQLLTGLACLNAPPARQVGTMISDVSRVLVVLLIIIFAFATALACVGTEQVRLIDM
jgi:hypothetical protein